MFLFFFSCMGQNEKENNANPDTAEESPLPEETWTDFSETLEELRSGTDIPALGGARLLDGEIEVLGASGLRSMDDTVEVDVWDSWHLGSCTKAMTATLVATFVEDGTFNWESTIG